MPTVDEIRQQISDKVLGFVEKDNQIILFLPLTQGTGKTITTVKTLLENNIKFVILGQNHEYTKNLVENSVIASYNLFVLKGRKQPISNDNPERMCKNERLDKIVNSYISVNEILCQECEYKDDCAYKEQFKYLEDTNESWVGVYQHMNVPFFKDYEYDVLILDENCISGGEGSFQRGCGHYFFQFNI